MSGIVEVSRYGRLARSTTDGASFSDSANRASEALKFLFAAIVTGLVACHVLRQRGFYILIGLGGKGEQRRR